jgi:hypothetical protein
MDATAAGEISETLQRIATVLGRDPHSRFALDLAQIVVERPQDAMRDYCTAGWWGGAGSVCDVWLESEADTQLLGRLLVQLVDGFEAAGVHCEPAFARANQFRDLTG